ncbi:hypothetical protein [Thermorudis peleae]|uniref:hypothetical protein n=1 Tax=Thermorudis peleae TaxID=1382356 RepID=UPI00056FC23B|nr:hypothetical protein [Thermorudis peleae]
MVTPRVSVLERLQQTPVVQQRSSRWYWFWIAQALVVATGFRLWFVLHSSFPLNDGGLFYTMVQDLEHAHFRLPFYTSYNHAHIPFAYPPLGFYVAAALDRLGWPVLSVFRFLPTLVNVASVAAFVPLSRAMLRSWRASAAATFAFALLPMAFAWQIMGGGITRAFGQLFAVIALHQAYRLYTRRQRRYVVGLALSAGLTVLSHPEAAWFLAYSVPLFWLFLAHDWRGLRDSLLAALGAVFLTSPWLVTVLARYGFAVLQPMRDSGWAPYSGIGRFALFDLTREPVFPLLGALALVGTLAALARRQFLLPVWLVVIPVLQSRAFDQRAVVPLALLAGIGLVEVVLPLTQRALLGVARVRLPAGGRLLTWLNGAFSPRRYRLRHVWLLQVLLILIVVQSVVATERGFRPLLTGLSADDRAAMAWVAEQTPPDARVLVVTGETWFAQDRVAEWFPALTGRTNVAVVQGYEWLGQFSDRMKAATVLQGCGTVGVSCLEYWAAQTGQSFDYIYLVSQPMWVDGVRHERFGALAEELVRDPDYALVYSGPGALIFHRQAVPSWWGGKR